MEESNVTDMSCSLSTNKKCAVREAINELNLARGRGKSMGFSLPEEEDNDDAAEEDYPREQGTTMRHCQPEDQVRPRLVCLCYARSPRLQSLTTLETQARAGPSVR